MKPTNGRTWAGLISAW